MTDPDPSPVGAILGLAFATDETAARYWLAECNRRGVAQPFLDYMWAEWSADHTPQTITSNPEDPMPDDELPDVYCPFASDGHCPANPPCPTPRDRACIGDDD